MVLPSKKVPPPPKEPGTHTNAEVKEALHARALRRTVIITAVVILLLAALAVVSSTAHEYRGPSDAKYEPKAIVIVASGLTPFLWDRSIRSNKAPFTRLINNSGGLYTALSASFAVNAAEQRNVTNLVRLLTGSTADDVKPTLSGYTSFLATLKDKFKPVIVAPEQFWSSNQMDNVDTACTRVGFFDAECTGKNCPVATDSSAYCNAYRKFVSCDGKAELYADDIVDAFNRTLFLGANLLYVQLEAFQGEENLASTVGNTLQKRSTMTLLDETIGRLAMGLAERTKTVKENWLVMVTSEGANSQEAAPLLMVVYSDGQVVQLKRPDTNTPLRLKTTDIRGTLLKWFNVKADAIDESRVIGLCSDGSAVANCNATQAS